MSKEELRGLLRAAWMDGYEASYSDEPDDDAVYWEEKLKSIFEELGAPVIDDIVTRAIEAELVTGIGEDKT